MGCSENTVASWRRRCLFRRVEGAAVLSLRECHPRMNFCSNVSPSIIDLCHSLMEVLRVTGFQPSHVCVRMRKLDGSMLQCA